MPDEATSLTGLRDTLVVRGVLVRPGDPSPDMGHDVIRVPVRIVWRDRDVTPSGEP